MENTECCVEECREPIRSAGYCHAHYERKRRGSDLNNPIRKIVRYASLREKLEAHREVSDGGCWIWTAGKAAAGYGMIRWGGASQLVHRMAYIEYVGEIENGRELDHQCRDRACFNPEHLKPVFRKENRENLGLDPRNTTGFRGVSKESRRDRWVASVTHNRKQYKQGGFKTPEEANEYAIGLRNELYTNNIGDR